jgi:large subunit ribosomal protein L33
MARALVETGLSLSRRGSEFEGIIARGGETGPQNPAFLDFSPLVARFAATCGIAAPTPRNAAMAKANMIKIKLLSSADTGYFYVTKKNSRTKTDKLVKKKYDPIAKKHVEFRETKIK